MQNSTGQMLYLIRHGHTGSGKRCISRTDIPLDEFGAHQAKRLGAWAAGKKLAAVYSSPLQRALQTAGALTSLPVAVRDELREVDVGEWEGLTFDEIKNRYPGDFAKRGERPGTHPPPGGESIDGAGARLLECLQSILSGSEGDIAVVSHGGANRGALCALLGQSFDKVAELPQPWGGISEIEISHEGRMTVKSAGEMPDKYPDGRSTQWLRDRYEMPEHVRAHCDAVAKKAVELASRTALPADSDLLYCAAKLHDIARARGPGHAEEGARLMRESGYPAVSKIIACHHDLPEGAAVEAQVLFLADKLVLEDREVTLRERFEKSREKCGTAEALEAWKRRFDSAVSIAEMLGLEV